VYGGGEQIRNWIYVDDCVVGIDTVFRNAKDGSVYNIGGAEECTNLEVTRTLLTLLGKTEDDIEFVPDRAGHDFRYALSSEKVERELGWKPTTPFSEGIQKTVAFYAA
jgi:dTDP-glucose 4,6-dehydratase